MKPRKAAVFAVSAAVLIALGVFHWAPNRLPPAALAPTANPPPTRGDFRENVATELPASGSPQATNATESGTTASPGTAENWFLSLDNPETIVKEFERAVRAGESGEIGAVRAIDQLLVICAPLIEYVRGGGSKERWMQDQYPPPAGPPDPKWKYDRCAAVAKAPEFADWSAINGQLNHEYWRAIARRLDDPLYRSFAVAEAMGELKRASAADRTTLKAQIAEDVSRVLRSGDGAAWVDFGGRAVHTGLTSDRGSALALVMAGCERGYDCSSANPANIFLDCRINGYIDCGTATTLVDNAVQDASPAVKARAHARHLELTVLLQQNDWDAVARFLALDGEAFKQD